MPDIGSVIGGGAAILGGALGAKGAKDAAKTQSDAAKYAADLAWQQYQQTRTDLSPWRTGGAQAAGRLGELLGFAPMRTGPMSPTGAPVQPGTGGISTAGRTAGTPRQPFNLGYSGHPGAATYGGTGGSTIDAATDAATGQVIGDYADPDYVPSDDFGSLLNPVDFNGKKLRPKIEIDMTGLDPNIAYDDAFTLDEFYADPSYAFRQSQGEQALNRAAAARGMFDSGAAFKELLGFNSDLASQEYGNAYNRWAGDRAFKYGADSDAYNRLFGQRMADYGAASDRYNRTFNKWATKYSAKVANKDRIYNYLMGYSNQGLNAAGQTGNAGMNAVNTAGNFLTSGAAATAAGQVGAANSWMGAISDIYNNYNDQKMLDRILAAT